MENVGMLVHRGLREVLGSLAEIGYDAEWQDIRAEDMDAPHKRERIWIVAYPGQFPKRSEINGFNTKLQHSETEKFRTKTRDRFTDSGKNKISNPNDARNEVYRNVRKSGAKERIFKKTLNKYGTGNKQTIWAVEPSICGMVDGVSPKLDGYQGRVSIKSYKRVDRLKGIGNSILPQIAELLFNKIKGYL